MSHIEFGGREVRLMDTCLLFEAMMPALGRIFGFQASLELASIACACSSILDASLVRATGFLTPHS